MAKLLSFYVLLLVLLSGCRTLRIERPPESYLAVKPAGRLSDINLPVEITEPELGRLINARLTGELYADTSFEDHDKDNLTIRAVKKGDITLRTDGNQYFYRVPLHLEIRKRITLGVGALSYTDVRTATADIALKFRTRIVLNSDWSISPTTFSDGYEWLATPTLKLGYLDLPVTMIADYLLKNNQKTLNKAIDQALVTALSPATLVAGVWKDIRKPVRIPGEHPLWLRVTPVEISALPLQSKDGCIRQTIGIRALIEASYGDEPATLPAGKPPPLKIVSRIESDFNINLAAEIMFPKLDELANAQLKGLSYAQGGKKVTVERVTTFGSEGKLIFGITLSGSLNATVYLAGLPYYDKPAGTLRIGDLDFDIRTRNVLAHSASWLFHKKLTATLEGKLIFPLREQMESVRRELSEWMTADRQLDIFRFSGSVDAFDLDRVDITPAALQGTFIFSGKMKFRMVAGSSGSR
jgi:hypothetical protein